MSDGLYYISATIKEGKKVRRYRNWLHKQLSETGDYNRVEPHVTIHPGVRISDAAMTMATQSLLSLKGRTARSTGLEFYPTLADPVVVMAGVDFDLSGVRDYLEDLNGEGRQLDPVAPHVTLMRIPGPVGSAEAPECAQDDLAWRKSGFSDWTATIKDVRIKAKEEDQRTKP